ncbi:tetratricopeptide repeat protein [Vibrio cholerae]|uniref:tetratricopeptide repeat protein n=1 Tax=Vibrio cholerae TaxID=666 RepID=UPI000E6D5783|nr:tetratricopeptide repeat protein [Vibrio cholerae]
MRYLLLFLTFSIGLLSPSTCFASDAANQATIQSKTVVDQTWLIGQLIELQAKSAKLEATLQLQNVSRSDLKNVEAELNRLQVQLVEVKEKLTAQTENQAKELASYDRRISDVSWNTNMWGLILTVFGAIITVAAIFLGFTAKKRAVAEAQKEAQNYIKTQSSSLLKAQEQKFKDELKKHSAKFDELHGQQEIQGKLIHVQTIFDKAREDFNDKNYGSALLAFGKVLVYIGSNNDPRLKDFACRALFAKGLAQGKLNQSEQEIQTYNDLIAYVSDDQTPALREYVVKAMLNKGVRQGQLNQSEQEIQTYNDLIAFVGDDQTPALREQVAMAMVNKGVTQGQLNQSEQEIQTYNDLIAYVGDDQTPALREQVAMAMLNKGITQGQLNQSEQAIQTYNDLIAYVGDDQTPALREHVAMVFNQVGFILLCQSKSLIQKSEFDGANILLNQALEKFELAIREHASGICIGNKAYALALLGQLEGSEQMFANALRAEVDGGETLYQGTLKDFDIHPIEQDKAFRETVERQWTLYQQALKVSGE